MFIINCYLTAFIDMPAFNSLNTEEFHEKYDVDKDGFLNLVSWT